MKKLLVIIALAAITTVGCATGTRDNNKETGVEKASSLSQNDDGGTSLIGKDQFVKKVWNYEE